MPEGMFAGFIRARQAQANLEQTELQNAALINKEDSAQVAAQQQAALAMAVRQVMGVEPVAPGHVPEQYAPEQQQQAPATGAARNPIAPDAGQQLARAAGLPHNMAVREADYTRSRAEQQSTLLANLGRIHILAGEANVGRQYIEGSIKAEKAESDLEKRSLEINAKQYDAMGSLASTVHDQPSLDRAILAAQYQGYDPKQLMDITGGGQWNEDSEQALEQFSRAALTVKQQSDLELDQMAEERQTRNTEDMIADRTVRQGMARANLALRREGLELRRDAARDAKAARETKEKNSSKGAGRVGNMTFSERKALFAIENKLPDPFEMRELKKHNPAAYHDAVARLKTVDLDFNRWHIRTFGVTPLGREPDAPVEKGLAYSTDETGPVDFEGMSDKGLDDLVKASSARSVGIPKDKIDAEKARRASAKASKAVAKAPTAAKARAIPEAVMAKYRAKGWSDEQIARAVARSSSTQ